MPLYPRRLSVRWLLVASTTLIATVAFASPPAHVARATDPDLPSVGLKLGIGAGLIIKGIDLEGRATPVALDLERFRAFTDDAKINVNSNKGVRTIAAPHNAYYRGVVSSEPDLRVVMTFREAGGIRGLLTDGTDAWVIQSTARQTGVSADFETRTVAMGAETPFECGNDSLVMPGNLTGGGGGAAAPPAAGSAHSFTARVAVDTDFEFYDLFGNTTDTTDYIADLFAYSSSIYEAEVATSLHVSSIDLWTAGAGSDPYVATDCNTMLSELRGYWNTNKTGVSRTIVHLLSGKPTGCGIAYVGVLCNGSYGYGVSAGLDANFTLANPNIVWDIVVVSHEIGHNFNSPHTHCYAGIGGPDNVDECYGSGGGGCYSGPTSLPDGCPGSGMGCGTIMSYCHLLSGGLGNLSLTFGMNHPYGVDPGRVPDHMSAHVISSAGSFPGCLDPINQGPLLTIAKAGGGSGTVTSNPAGIDCGGDCTQNFATNEIVALTAVANAGSSFAGFTGDADCSDGSVTMDADKTCTATFVSLCGNGVVDSGEQCDGGDLGGATCGGCAGSVTCNSNCTLNTSACTNGVCDPSETCASCAADCTGAGATCGNGTCEAGDGEDCLTCPADCNGKQSGKRNGRYCCGFGGENPVACDPGQCGACSTGSSVTCCGDGTCGGAESSLTCVRDCGAPAVCGDGTCNSSESQCSCAADCGAPPASEALCSDGSDNDCDGQTDCDDSDCGATPACSCQPVGSSCTTGAECCSNNCKGKSGRKTCK